MSVYRTLGNRIASAEAIALADRLAAWHDALVKHERRLLGLPGLACGDECPHLEARSLWLEARRVFGERAYDLRLLAKHGARGEQPAAEGRRIA
jgi:hypothetical protein